jgi:hypothetical protein
MFSNSEKTRSMERVQILSFLNYDTHFETLRLSIQNRIPFFNTLTRKDNIITLPIDLVTIQPDVIITNFYFNNDINLNYFLKELMNYDKSSLIITNNVDEVRMKIEEKLGAIPNNFFITSRYNITPMLYGLYMQGLLVDKEDMIL